MSEFMLLGKIKKISPDAARELEKADMRTDSLIRSLTREDLNELFPGPQKFKLRRDLLETIHRPADALIKDLKGFIPRESLRGALSSSGVLVDYLHVLKDMKTQMNQVQGFLDAHIGLLEELSKEKPDEERYKDSLPNKGTSDTKLSVHYNGQTDRYSQGAQNSLPGRGKSSNSVGASTGSPAGFSQGAQGTSGSSGPVVASTGRIVDLALGSQRNVYTHVRQDFVEVKYQMLVSGKTHGAHQQLMDKVLTNQVYDRVRFVESSEDHQITILFCTNSSRIESNVEAAMSDVKDEKPVILVLMYHERDPKSITPRIRTDNSQVVLHVQVFFHETKNGLLTCSQNDAAVTNIQQKLLEYSPPKCVDTRENAPSIGAESGGTVRGGDNRGGGNSKSYYSDACNRDGGNSRSSHGDGHSGGSRWWPKW